MKRVLVVVLIGLVFLSVNAFAAIGLGIGAAFNLELFREQGVYPGAAISISPPKLPIVFGAGAVIGSSSTVIGITADWWLVQQKLVGIVGIYTGPGLYLRIADPFEFGLRIPVGFQIFPLKPLEVFVEVTPQLGIGFGDPIVFPQITLVGAIGCRFWF